MAQKFMESGYNIVDISDKFDICIVNTCTVTNMSDRKSRQHLRQLKEKNNNAVIVAVGCYAQVAKEELEKMEEIDIVLGNNEKNNIVEEVENYLLEKNKIYKTSDLMQQREFKDFGSVVYTEKTRAVVKVQDGCDRFCSYCIIPYARGRVRSRKPESIIDEITKIANEGIKEVVITGIHIASYGKDFSNGYKLIDLLEEINKIKGIERIRLGSIEPLLISEEFIKRLVKLDKVCHHFHLSLQSGCDDTLKRMNRRYTTKEFEEIVDRIRQNYDDAILTTDIIVGFPGETDDDFKLTYNYLSKIKFYKMHVFKYSPRKGTKAAIMENQISGDIKEKRSGKLIELSNKNELEYNKDYIGKNVNVLIEEKSGEYYKGHTSNYILVKCLSENDIENRIVEININQAKEDCLIGKLM